MLRLSITIASCLVLASTAEAASFNCNLAKSASEVAICNSAELSDLDVRMSERYFKVRNLLPKEAQGALKSANKTFLERRNSCGSDRDCLTFQYENFMSRTCEIAQTSRVACE